MPFSSWIMTGPSAPKEDESSSSVMEVGVCANTILVLMRKEKVKSRV
jgi:hypothetical protein